LEWRPSRWLEVALILLGACAVVAVLASDLPRMLAWPLSCAAVLHASRAILKHRRQAIRTIDIEPGGKQVPVDGSEVRHFRVSWRGHLAFATWDRPGGGKDRLCWWPDTLSGGKRRELRIAASPETSAHGTFSVAP